MKKLTISIILLLLFLSNYSCRNNRLKTNEKELAKDILIKEREKEQSEDLANEMQKSETRNGLSVAIRKKEIRTVDPQRPPVRINIPGTQNNTRELKLSNFASSIRYVKLQTPPDTLLLYDHFFYRNDLESNIRSDGENIIFQGLFGLTRFNMQGEYLETIWKNETGIRLMGNSAFFGGQDFFGVLPHIPVSLINGTLYSNFQDGPGKKGQVMKYKLSTSKNISLQLQTEGTGQGHFPGDTVFNTKKNWWDGFSRIFCTGQDTWAGINNKWKAGTSGAMLVTYNDQGDTLCLFTDYDRIVNFSLPNTRTAVDLAGYTYNGLVTIKQEYNDTVFRLILPDRLLPVYIIDFGEYKFSFMDGFNADIDLSDKYMLNSLDETNDYLFIRYTQNLDAPITRKKNSVKFYNTIFSKKDAILYHQPGFTLLPEGIANDIDGGMSFWPDFITPQGEMMKLFSGNVIMDYVNSEGFKRANITVGNRQKQISMASRLKPTDMIIMIVK